MSVDWQQALMEFFGTSDVTQYQGQNGEPGVDIGVPAGAPVRAVESGTYVAALSTPDETVLRDRNGLLLDYMHIDPFGFSDGQTVPAGTVVGSVTTKDVSPGGSQSFWFGGKHYSSTGPHLEFGVYQPGQPVGDDNQPGLNPLPFLAALASQGNGSSGSGGPFLGIGPGGWFDPTHIISGNAPNVGNAINSALHPVESFIGRIALTAVFLAAALGVGFILVSHLANGGNSSNVRVEPIPA